MPEQTIEQPTAETKTELVNPVIPEGMDLSKKIFNEAMEAEKPPAVVEEPAPAEEVLEKPPAEVQPDAPAPPVIEQPVSEAPEAKTTLPEELLTGKKEEPKVDEDIAAIDAMVLPKNAKPEQQASFAKLKESAKTTILAREATINELKSKTASTATKAEIEEAQERVKTAQARATELEQTIERLAFTESPRFKQLLSDETASLGSAKTYFEGTEINPEIIEVAARSTGSNRIKVLTDAGADANLIAAVSPYLAQYDSIQRSKASSIENWKTESAQFAEAQKVAGEQATAKRKADENKVWSDVFSKHESTLVPYRKFDKSDSWNARADELKTRAKQVFNGEDVGLEVVADVIAKGVAYDALDEVRVALTDEIRNLATENARLKAAKPTGGDTQGAPTSTNGAELTPVERQKNTFNTELAKAKGG